MSLLPRTLLGRNLLLIVALVVLGQIVGGLLVRELLFKPRLDQVAAGLAHTVDGLRSGLVGLPPQERAAFVARFNAQQPPVSVPVASRETDPSWTELAPLERLMVRAVSRHLAVQGADVIWRREAGGTLALRIPLDGVDYWVMLPGVLPVQTFTGAWLSASLAGALLALIGALLIQRHLHRPLTDLTRAARQVAQGHDPAALPVQGPREIATLAASFNHMARSLRQADRQRALMLAGISHDLRTPLTKLRLGIEILREPAGPELAARMERSIAEMDAIVGQFLDFARADEDEPLTSVAIDALAREVAHTCTTQGQPVQVEQCPLSHPSLQARPRLLRRAVLNLLENAWRHGQPPVILRTGGDATCCWIEVEDHGPGIAPADAHRLRQPFVRGEPARGGAAPKGAGLGLSIVERAARVHGGTLDLLQAPAGTGLRARLSLPRQEPLPSPPAPIPVPVLTPGRSGPASPPAA